MDQNNNSQNNLNMLPEKNYLVTQAVSTSSLPQQKVSSDLDQLVKAEKRSEYKVTAIKGISNPQVSVAMSALRLANPFKGY
jgi:predicted transcriptional regulator